MPNDKKERVEKWKLTPEMTQWVKSYQKFVKMQKQIAQPLMFHAQKSEQLKDAFDQLQTGKSQMLQKVPQISKDLDKQPEFETSQMELRQ